MKNDVDPIVQSCRAFVADSRRLLRDAVAAPDAVRIPIVDGVGSALARLPADLCDRDVVADSLDELVGDETIRAIPALWIRIAWSLGWADIQRNTARSLIRALRIAEHAIQLVDRDQGADVWASFQLMAGDAASGLGKQRGESALPELVYYERVLDTIPRAAKPTLWVAAAERLASRHFVDPDAVDQKRAQDVLQQALAEMQKIGDEQASARVRETLKKVMPMFTDAAASGRPPAFDEPEERNPTASAESVVFTAFYPRTCVPGRRYSFIVYTHLPDLLPEVTEDASMFSNVLGGATPTPRTTKQAVRLAPGTRVTVAPECTGCRLDPEEQTKEWDGTWTRFPFDFNVPDAMVNETLLVNISIQVAGIEIASIKNCAIDAEPAKSRDTGQNPLAAAKAHTRTSTLHQMIFVSYASEDAEARNRYLFGQRALGNETFVDVENLRAGQNWKAGLADAIDRADVFQLLWSRFSANSEYCRYEWQYAQSSHCSKTGCEGFIRAAYWETPMPTPPEELKDLNFRFVPVVAPNVWC